MKFLYVFEFNSIDALADAVIADMEASDGVKVARSEGIIKTFDQNGAGLKRLVNFFYMHLVAPFVILRSRADCVIVRTTPPLIQITYALWCAVLRRKYVCWLMDYHPLVGLGLSRKGSFGRLVWSFFDFIDRLTLPLVGKFVVLDDAMAELVRSRCPSAKISVCPTWNLQESEYEDMRAASVNPLKLLYSGNLGTGHTFELVEPFLAEAAKRQPVELHYCGNSETAEARMKALAAASGVSFKAHVRIKNFSDMGAFFKKNGFHYGVVILNENQKGTVSPSKFNGYISFGLPVVYFGPEKTNSCDVCSKYGAGIAVAKPEDIPAAAEKICSVEVQNALAAATASAKDAFSVKLSKKTADAIFDFAFKS